jgi:phage FluMu protein Com
MDEYRCERCNHLLFRGSLKLLLTKRADQSSNTIETKCRKCGKLNQFSLVPTVEK